MRPPILHQHLHLIHQTKPPRLIPLPLSLPPSLPPSLLPRPHLRRHSPFPQPPHRQPPPDPILPDPDDEFRHGNPDVPRVNDVVSGFGVGDADVRTEIDAVLDGEGVVGVDEAAFGTFEVGSGEGVRDAAELEGVVGVGEGGCVHEYLGDDGGLEKCSTRKRNLGALDEKDR